MIQWESNQFNPLDKKSGDRDRVQNALDYETDTSRDYLNAFQEDLMVPNAQNMFNNYNRAAERSFQDYGDIMGRYADYLDEDNGISADTISAERVDPFEISYSRTPELSHALRGYGEFADTGGFDQNAIRDMRSRGMAPIRAAYGDTIRELDRARALGGPGGASNYIAARSRAQRELPQQLSDAQQNVNADLARMIQQGRLAGLGGLSSTAQADIGFDQRAQMANQDANMRSRLSNQAASLEAARANQAARLSASQSNLGSRLSALGGMSSLYSATPGAAQVFGNQALGAQGNLLNLQGLRQDLGKTKVQGQLNQSQIPTGFQSFLGNMGQIGNIAGNFAGFGGFTGGGGGYKTPWGTSQVFEGYDPIQF